MITATRRFEVDAAHRLQHHEGLCANLHGHRYTFEVTVTAPALDENGCVVDFGVVKRIVGRWLDDHLDHATLVEATDPLLGWLEGNNQRHFVMRAPSTIENLCMLVYSTADELLRAEVDGLEVVRVRGHETPNCWAEVVKR